MFAQTDLQQGYTVAETHKQMKLSQQDEGKKD